MSFLDKFKNKHAQAPVKTVKAGEAVDKSELTLAELKEKQSTQAKAGNAKSQVKKDDTKQAYKVLIRPLITEKGTYLAAENKYLFEVGVSANKSQVKRAVKALYNVSPIKVNIVNVSGKKVRYGKHQGITKNKKKAVITLKQGESINIYEGV